MTIVMRKCDSQVPQLATQDSESPLVIPSQEVPISQNQHMLTSYIQINVSEMPQHEHQENPQYEKKMSVRVDKETKGNVE